MDVNNALWVAKEMGVEVQYRYEEVNFSHRRPTRDWVIFESMAGRQDSNQPFRRRNRRRITSIQHSYNWQGLFGE